MNISFCESVLLCSRELDMDTCCGSLWQHSLLVKTLFPQVFTSTVESPVTTRSEGFLWGILLRPSCNGMFQIIIPDVCCFFFSCSLLPFLAIHVFSILSRFLAALSTNILPKWPGLPFCGFHRQIAPVEC